MTACADTLLETLENPAVRDLAWACFSPPLLLSEEVAPDGMDFANCGLPLDDRRQDWLRRLDRDPGPLLQHLQSLRSRRLGLYFEALWHFFLEQDERVELLGHNLPVRDGNHTVGEFDCLYHCHERRRNFHLELAVKFYLGAGSGKTPDSHSSWNCWLGPGSRDRLDLKMNRLLQHQLQLGGHPRGKELLASLGIEQVAVEMEIKGRLFNRSVHPLPPPFGYNSNIPLGSWTARPAEGVMGAVLDKSHWLAPVTSASRLCPAPLPRATRPQLVAVLDQRGYELERFFHVPPHWPGRGEYDQT